MQVIVLSILAIKKDDVAVFIRRLLRHKEFNSLVKRMGIVARISHAGITIWRLHKAKQFYISWND